MTVGETIRARFDRRAERGVPRWALVWPGLAGCAIWIVDGFHLLLVDPQHATAPTFGILMLPGLLLWAPWCIVIAMSDRPSVRRPALLANGAFLIATVAVLLTVF